MKAYIYEKYGPPEVLHHKEAEKPSPKNNEVLIKIHATTVAAGDVRMRGFKVPKAMWLPARLALGLTGPKRKTLGMEIAGVVEATGQAAKKFRVGDEVYAATGFGGGYAEYVCLPESKITKNLVIVVEKKPANLSFEQAATIPVAGLTALAFLRKAALKSGQKILIYGASGSVGTYAVQLAKLGGAEVTAVCGTQNVALVKSLGADKVIDYTQQDYAESQESYDVVFDAVGKTSKSKAKKVLGQNGLFLSTWGSARVKDDDLAVLRGLVESGKLLVVLDRTYRLDEIVLAHRYVEEGHKKGNVAVTI